MNENNQPQSQQTKRERGLYHVKRNGYWTVAEYTDHHGQWRVFNNTDQMQSRDFEEIDERRIERSHSPTEQPGDAKHTPLPQGKYYYGEADQNGVKPVFGAHDQLLWFSAPGSTTRFSDEKEAGRAAKIPALLSEVSTLRSKQAELVAENERQRDQMKNQDAILLSRMNEIYQQAETIKRLTEALESPLTFEQYCFLIGADPWHAAANTIWKTLELHGFVIVAKSALSGGSKQ